MTSMKRSLQRSGDMASWLPSAFLVTGSSASTRGHLARRRAAPPASVSMTIAAASARFGLLLGGGRLRDLLHVVGLGPERLAIGGVALGEDVDGVVADVVEALLPERRRHVVLRGEVDGGVEEHDLAEGAQLVLGEAGRERGACGCRPRRGCRGRRRAARAGSHTVWPRWTKA